MISAKS